MGTEVPTPIVIPVRCAPKKAPCPKCGSDLKETLRSNIALDVCTGCGGVWFDAGELETLLGARESAVGKLLRSFSRFSLDAAPNDAPGGLEKK